MLPASAPCRFENVLIVMTDNNTVGLRLMLCDKRGICGSDLFHIVFYVPRLQMSFTMNVILCTTVFKNSSIYKHTS